MGECFDWLCGNPDKYGFDPATGDYAPIMYVFGALVGIPLSIILIASVANGVREYLRAPFVRTRKDSDDRSDPFWF